MDIKQLNEELRNLEKQAGKKSSDTLLQIIEFRMEDFKSYIDQRFTHIDQRFSNIDQRFSILQWMMGIGFTVLALLITVLKFIG